MTWVLATAFGIFGSMIADVRICRMKGGNFVPYSVGLRKVYPFSERTVFGFAGEVKRCFAALDSVNAYIRANGYDQLALSEQLQGWADSLVRGNDPLSASSAKYPVELLALRSFVGLEVSTESKLVLVGGVHVGLPHEADTEFRLRPFIGVDHIGSGSDLSSYRDAAEETNKSLAGFAGFAQAGGGGFIGQIYANQLSDVILKSGEPTVSPDVDIVVLTGAGHWRASLRRSDPPLRVCQSLRELEPLARAEDAGAAFAMIA